MKKTQKVIDITTGKVSDETIENNNTEIQVPQNTEKNSNLFVELFGAAAPEGETFGVNAVRLEFKIGEAHSPMTVLGMTAQINVSTDETAPDYKEAQLVEYNGVVRSLPIGAVFEKNWKLASLKKGDVIAVGRFPDAVKKKGKGKGVAMQTYGIRVLSRKK